MEIRNKKFLLFLFILIILLLLVGSTITSGILYASSRKGTGAIASNGVECAKMGKRIFLRGGNVADAAVTTILCEGVSNPASCGIGGGFVLVIYLKEKGIIQSLNARETAPINSKTDMFVENPQEAVYGGKSVAVPSDLKGIWELHQKYGTMKWKELLQPVIDMCRKGHIVNAFLEEMLDRYENLVLAEPTLREIFMNPETKKTFRMGDKMKRLKLAETLETIANDGIDAIYGGGNIGKELVEDIRKHGGIIIEKDLTDYKVEWSDPISMKLNNNQTLYTTPLPTTGAMIILMLNILRYDKLYPNLVGYQRIIEAMKIAYAHRTRIGADKNAEVLEIVNNMIKADYSDQLRRLIKDTKTSNDAKYYGANYANINDHGTSHLSILAPNGDAISVTTTINYVFGAMFRSHSTGIILNNEMNDFSIPGGPNEDGVLPSPNNFPIPGNNPLSSMTPIIIVDENGNVRLIIGAAGGMKITSSTVYILFRIIFFNEPLEIAMKAPRLHHQLTPMTLSYEPNFDRKIIRQLNIKIGHKIREKKLLSRATAVGVENGKVKACFEPRMGGSAEVFQFIKYVYKYY